MDADDASMMIVVTTRGMLDGSVHANGGDCVELEVMKTMVMAMQIRMATNDNDDDVEVWLDDDGDHNNGVADDDVDDGGDDVCAHGRGGDNLLVVKVGTYRCWNVAGDDYGFGDNEYHQQG